MTKTPILTNILLKTKMLVLKVIGRLPFRMNAFKKAHQVAHSERVTSKMIVKKEWVWEWATDKVVATMSKTKVEVLMLFRKVAALFKRFKKLSITTTNKEHTKIK